MKKWNYVSMKPCPERGFNLMWIMLFAFSTAVQSALAGNLPSLRF